MHEQRGTFNGIDTFGLTDFRRFDFTSILHSESEAYALKNRPDINSLLTQITKEKVIGESIATSHREEAERITEGIDFSIYSRGATYVPFDAAMTLLKDIDEENTTATVDHNVDHNNYQAHTRYFKKIWPSYMYTCQ